VTLDRDISADAGACVVESRRGGRRSDVAAGLFVPVTEFVRHDAPAAPDLAARPGERRLSGPLSRPEVGLFAGPRHLRVVVTDAAPLSIQREFRTQRLQIACFGPEQAGAGQALTTARFPPRSREVVARFEQPIGSLPRLVCGVEAADTGTEAYGSID
jgi:hypothetical protein